MSDHPQLVGEAQEALADGDWARARVGFLAALAVAQSAEAQAGLATAMWWLGEIPESFGQAEQAYTGYRRGGEMAAAARVALWLSLRYWSHVGNKAVAAGWLARARTLIADHQVVEFTGWVKLYEASAADEVAGEALARQARDHARQHGDTDLELCAISQIGAKLVEQGRIREGMGYLDEAMAGALAGEGGDPVTVVYASCNTLTSCAKAATLERAMQWVRAADRFTRRFGCPFLFARCRALYGAALVAVGDWVQAEEELQAAVRLSRDALPAVHAEALVALADLRLAQGRLEEAERLIAGSQDDEPAAAVAARLHLARGRARSAESVLRRRLVDVDEGSLAGFSLRELLGAAELAQGRAEDAANRGQVLVEAGEQLGCDIAVARGNRLLGRALAAAGPSEQARTHLDRAVTMFARLRLPLETAHTRLELGRQLAEVAPELALEELRRAFDTFEGLGAARDADDAAALLRGLGARPARAPSQGRAPLSPREHEVFALLGEGLANPEIAERLYISHRTVEHHVSRVVDKLGLRTRAEAMVEAVRRGATADPARGATGRHR